MVRRVCVVFVWAVLLFTNVNVYPSADARSIASTDIVLTMSLGGLPSGQLPVVISGTTSKCLPGEVGRLRFVASAKIAQLCTGSVWVPLGLGGTGNLGRTQKNPASSCLNILTKGQSKGDGLYWIKHPGYSGPAYQAYCDMTLEGGGWTLFAAKVSARVQLLTDRFESSSAKAVSQNSIGCIPGNKWKEVLFRFRSDGGANRVVYNRRHGNHHFNNDLTCGGGIPSKVEACGGFYKHSRYENGGRRIPSKGLYRIPDFHMRSSPSQGHHPVNKDSNKWLDLWDAWTNFKGTRYIADSPRAKGTKCIAGVCKIDEPVWLMYR